MTWDIPPQGRKMFDTTTNKIQSNLNKRLLRPDTPTDSMQSKNTSLSQQPQSKPVHFNNSQPRVSTEQISNDQRLQIAQAELNKILSRKGVSNQTVHRTTATTSENQRVNEAWGDPLTEKPEGVTRVYSLNVNGLSLDSRGGRFDDLCQVTKEVQADICCVQEHNLDTTRTQVQSILFDTLQFHWHRSRITFGSTPIPFLTNYKPGGTMVCSVGNVTGRIIEQHQDRYGRWVSQFLREAIRGYLL